MLKEVFQDAESRMQEAIQHLKREFGSVRTGRASPALLDSLRVDYYGTPTPVRQIASISVPEPNLLVVSPWDQSHVIAVTKAIQASDLGLTPSSDGRIIRLTVPPLTDERRREQVKKLRRMSEEGRVAVRNIRREANSLIEELQKEKEISEDEQRRGLAEIQKLTDRFIGEVDKAVEAKEKEILEE